MAHILNSFHNTFPLLLDGNKNKKAVLIKSRINYPEGEKRVEECSYLQSVSILKKKKKYCQRSGSACLEEKVVGIRREPIPGGTTVQLITDDQYLLQSLTLLFSSKVSVNSTPNGTSFPVGRPFTQGKMKGDHSQNTNYFT